MISQLVCELREVSLLIHLWGQHLVHFGMQKTGPDLLIQVSN
jgi:hypothetical protein